ncbi:hypothetical protein VPFG_00157 [Vibrio phage nt-1]|uniref:Uncharacterized protein n=1 Tax=Vibrio phage nt-1 TaxID=115992 RepID=R9TFC1_9CAUD|nr:hypothetical protein VPFG_00157 [Vibrio phage nt-1]AGN30159.1 hypothetical protein VPFG_00157 [Vibrio phage nt-1]
MAILALVSFLIGVTFMVNLRIPLMLRASNPKEMLKKATRLEQLAFIAGIVGVLVYYILFFVFVAWGKLSNSKWNNKE